jgi:hypothetical protein
MALLTSLLFALVACGSGEGSQSRATPRTDPPPTLPSVPYRPTVADLERFAEVRLPAGATGITITMRPSPARPGEPIFTARFTTTEQGARRFCEPLGGDLPYIEPLDRATRTRFGITAASLRPPRGCRSSITSRLVEREAIVVFPDGKREVAVVHLIAYPVPTR